MPAACAVKIL